MILEKAVESAPEHAEREDLRLARAII